MEEIQEFAGHLKAELLAAREEYNHGRMAKNEYLRRIEIIRKRRESAMFHHTRLLFTAEPQRLSA